MATCIRHNNKLKGLSPLGSDCTIKISQYADDAVIFLNNEEELSEAINEINRFGNVSGTMLNIKKCEGLWISSENK